MRRLDALLAAGEIEELGDALVEPEGDGWHDGMHVAVRRLVSEVFGDPILPGRKHRQGRVGLDEKGPAHRKAWELPGREGVVAGLVPKIVRPMARPQPIPS